jgi:Ca2+-binding EF-hand superfamily protein
METVRSPRDADGFARLDVDRDGYVSWPEFHGAMRATLQRGDVFRVRTVRPFVPPSPEARPATPLQKFLQLQDTNQNGGLDPAEIDRYLREREQPGLGGLLRSLDQDRNGRLEEAELAPWFDKLPGQAENADKQAANPRLSAPWQAADHDQNGTIDATELAAVLRRLDPAMAIWATELLRALDRSRDGELQPEELPGNKPADQAAAIGAGPPPLPARLPAR